MRGSNNIFYVSLYVSVGFHSLLLLGFPLLHLPALFPKSPKDTRFVYEKIDKLTAKQRILRRDVLDVERLRIKLKRPPPYIKPLARIPINRNSLHISDIKPSALRIGAKKSIGVKIAVSSLLTKFSSSLYTSYYEAIRERVKMMAYKNFKFQENGKVSLSFIIHRDGRLLRVEIRKAESQGTQRLFTVARKSIVDASPFPEFPESLDYPYLTFNLLISFQYKA